MAQLFYTQVGQVFITDQQRGALWRLLPKWQQRRLLCCRDGVARDLSLTAWTLLSAALSHHWGSGALDSLERGPNGKPFFRDGPHFNLAHCPGLALCALSDSPVGADVERGDALPSLVAVRNWTRRESFEKYLGPDSASHQADPPCLPWTGALPGGFVVSLCTGPGTVAPTITEWNEEALWNMHRNGPVR